MPLEIERLTMVTVGITTLKRMALKNYTELSDLSVRYLWTKACHVTEKSTLIYQFAEYSATCPNSGASKTMLFSI